MANHQELSSLIWNVCDDVLRGLFKPHEYGDIILPFVVLRRLDCVLEPKKDRAHELFERYKNELDDLYPVITGELQMQFYNHSKYDLARLKHDPKNIHLNFRNYLDGFSKNVFDIIENFQIQKPVEKLERNNKLYLFIEKFTAVDLHPEVVDNHAMGQIFEELLRRFSEMSNETSGEHYTPRDIVQLLVALLFSGSEDDLKGAGKIRSLFDPCCGTGGMLTIGKKWVRENINPGIEIHLNGQELNPQTYSICKSDMLISGENPDSIRLGSSLSMDAFDGKKFEYMLTNPPFGVSWKGEEEFVKEEARDSRGRFFAGTPRTSDGSLLFLQHMISKMEPDGSRVGIIFNGSPLFTGDAGSGESEIRKWIIENDMLECIVQLPDSLFFNTGITTYIWIVTNRKHADRRGKVQLINAAELFKPRKKSLGNKRKEVSPEQIDLIVKTYTAFVETDICKIFPNSFFGYTKVTVERPLVEKGQPVTDKKGNLKPDSSLRDYERIPLDTPVEEYFVREVKPHLPDAWLDRSKDTRGYEINFTKYFYRFTPLRSLEEITKELLELEKESDNLMKELFQ